MTLAAWRAKYHVLAHGGVIGRLREVGGPAPGAPRPVSGTITIVNVSTGGRFSTAAEKNRWFWLTVPVGRYRLSAMSHGLSMSRTVDIVSGKSSAESVTWQVP